MMGALINKDRNLLKAICFEKPDYIPMTFHINDACFHAYSQDQLFDLMETHEFLFPNFVRPKSYYTPDYLPNARVDISYRDSFGCVWNTTDDGIVGTVTEHPLGNWVNFENYQLPNPNICNGIEDVDWSAEENRIQTARSNGDVVYGGLRHGHTFLQLCDLRGYENLVFDMVDEEPHLFDLIEKLEAFNMEIVKRYVSMDCDIITYAEDLGMQSGPLISPDHFRKYIKPSYKNLIQVAKEAGALIHMHSDGDIRLLVDELIDGGVNAVNLQDLVNGVDWIKDHLAGKVCVDLDIDRQEITVHGTPSQIDDLIREEVQKIGSKEGGLTMIYGLYPGVPPENIKALMDAMEKYAFYYN